MRKFLCRLLPCVAVLLTFAGCGGGSTAPARLSGSIAATDVPESVEVAYTFDGDMLNMNYAQVEVAEDGTFAFELSLPERTLDVDVYVGNGAYGAHLERGTETVMRLTQRSEGYGYDVAYEGANAELSRVVNACTDAFDIMKYFSPDPEYAKTFDEYRQILEDGYAVVKPQVEGIGDRRTREYYERIADGRYRWTKIRILMDEAYNDGRALIDYPEYAQMLEGIDPNDPINIRTNMLLAWEGAQHKLPNEFGADMSDYCIESIEIIEREITNPVVRDVLAKNAAYSFFTYHAASSDVPKFWERFKAFATDYPELIAAYEPKVESFSRTAKGSPMPYDPVMSDIGGKECRLSEFVAGKFAYIDIWATWCVPCRKEIPHFAEVAKHFRGNRKVCIVSISVDSNRGAWEKMISAEKPAWPQFILSDEEQRAFMDAWGIGGIPRFIMLDREGRIFAADAMRPSDENIIAAIEAEL